MRKMPPLSKYLKIYEKNPDSKVFAPLADSYRRLGMYEEALKVLKKGLRLYPGHTSAQVILAHTYYDTQKYVQALKILEPLASQNFYNHTLQKLYAKTNLRLGRESKALEGLKHLLFINPGDKEVIEILKKLEPQDIQGESQALLLTSSDSPALVEEWVQVDFIPKIKVTTRTPGHIEGKADDRQDRRGGHSLSEDPIVTHTLVDLYEQQGLRDKAAKVLEKIVELNPDDASSMTRLQKLKESISFQGCGNQALMDVWDQKFSKRSHEVSLKKVLLDFLNAIKLRGDNEKSTCY